MIGERAEKARIEIEKLRSEGNSCSRATLLGVARALGYPYGEKLLVDFATGFCGGIGRTRDRGTCGALTAAVGAVGLAPGLDDKQKIEISAHLYELFKEEFGDVECGALLRNAGGKKNCTACCLCAGVGAVQLIDSSAKEVAE